MCAVLVVGVLILFVVVATGVFEVAVTVDVIDSEGVGVDPGTG